MSYFQSAKYIAPLIIVKFTGAVSIIGSCAIVFDILKKKAMDKRNGKVMNGNRKKKLRSTTNRIILLMSICDIIYSFFAWFLGTWMVPKESGAFWASGNQATCTAQGFIQVLFYGSATCMNAILAIAYVLMAQCGWKNERMNKILPQFCFLVAPVLLFLVIALIFLFTDSYKFNGGPTCGVDRTSKLNAKFGMIWQLSCFSVIALCVIILFSSVLKREQNMDRYQFGNQPRNRKHSKQTAKHGILYAGSFLLTYLPFIIIYSLVLAGERFPYWLIVLNYICLPLQGFWNAIIYFSKKTSAAGADGRRFSGAWFRMSLNRVSLTGNTGSISEGASRRRSSIPSVTKKEEFPNTLDDHTGFNPGASVKDIITNNQALFAQYDEEAHGKDDGEEEHMENSVPQNVSFADETQHEDDNAPKQNSNDIEAGEKETPSDSQRSPEG